MRKHRAVLVLAGIVTFLTACGNVQTGQTTTEKENEATAAVTEVQEETTVTEQEEPTVDEYSDAYYLEQAEKLGIADPSYYDDLTADMNHEQFFTMLKKAHDLQYGEDSNCLIDGRREPVGGKRTYSTGTGGRCGRNGRCRIFPWSGKRFHTGLLGCHGRAMGGS